MRGKHVRLTVHSTVVSAVFIYVSHNGDIFLVQLLSAMIGTELYEELTVNAEKMTS